MYPENARSLKHELRTPVNHIIGYSALLLEAAQDAGDDLFSSQVVEIHAIGTELNKVIERNLLFSHQSVQEEDVVAIREAVAPLIPQIAQKLVASSSVLLDDSYRADMRRIQSALERLQSLLETSVPPHEVIEQIHISRG
jgi:signal transduction histidine kinase